MDQEKDKQAEVKESAKDANKPQEEVKMPYMVGLIEKKRREKASANDLSPNNSSDKVIKNVSDLKIG